MSKEAQKPEPIGLDALPPGKVGVVHGLGGGRHFISRMASLGFTPGTRVKMVQNYGRGPLIVSVRDARVALGRGEAGKVQIIPEDERKDTL
jgi:ferrous iron transport protein A